jgi:hypothetical protein
MKMIITVLALGFVTMAGCGGVSQGDECGGSQDDCGSNLVCQPIKGRSKNYCCPTPPEQSSNSNCHAGS